MKKKISSWHIGVSAEAFVSAHGEKTVFCLVQFKGTEENEMPRIYLARPSEIAEELHKARNGAGETVLREYHEWTSRSVAAGTTDSIPKEWKLTKERIEYFMNNYTI